MAEPLDTTDQLLELVGSIYEAALFAAAMPQALSNLVQCLGGNASQLVAWDNASGTVVNSVVASEVDAKADAAYTAYYGAIDPRRAWLQTLPQETVARCHQRFDERYVAGSEFYQDFFIPAGYRWVCGTQFDSGDGTSTVIGVMRERQAPAYEDWAARNLARAIPHFRRASILQRHLAQRSAAAVGAEALVHGLSIGCVLLDGRGRVLIANATAQAALPELPAQQAGPYLLFSDATQQARWIETVRRVATSRLADTLALESGSGATWRVHVVPLSSLLKPADAGDLDLLLAVFECAQRSLKAAVNAMRARHGLTQAEAEVLTLLAQGLSGKQIAAERGSSTHTIRAQLAAVYEKTGHHTQRALLAALRRGWAS